MRIRLASLLLAATCVSGGSSLADEYGDLFPLDVSVGQKLVILFSVPTAPNDFDTIAPLSGGGSANSHTTQYQFELFDGDELLASYVSSTPFGFELDGGLAYFTSEDSLETHSQAVIDFTAIRSGDFNGRLVISPFEDDPSLISTTTYGGFRMRAGVARSENLSRPFHILDLSPVVPLNMIDAYVVPTPTAASLAALACVGVLTRRRCWH